MSGVGGPNTTAYDAAKTAIVNFTENLALELQDTPITVNAISPGSIHTRMWEETRDLSLAIGDMATYRAGGAGNLRPGGVHRAGSGTGRIPGQRRLRRPVWPPHPPPSPTASRTSPVT